MTAPSTSSQVDIPTTFSDVDVGGPNPAAPCAGSVDGDVAVVAGRQVIRVSTMLRFHRRNARRLLDELAHLLVNAYAHSSGFSWPTGTVVSTNKGAAMAYRRTVEQRDRRMKRIRHYAQAITVVAGLGGGLGVGYLAQATVPAGAVATTTTLVPATTHVVAPRVAPRVATTTTVKAPVKAVAPVVKSTAKSTPVAVPVARTPVCTTSPSGTVVCH
jgi:hypothetical protein